MSGRMSVPVAYVRSTQREIKSYSWLQSLLWISMSFLWLGMNFLPNHLVNGFPMEDTVRPYGKANPHVEGFNPSYARHLRSVDDLYLFAKANTNPGDQRGMIEEASRVLRSRFHHAYGIYSMQENWMSVLAGHFIWKDLSAKVIADDILKGDVAACSQASIVFMAFCHRVGVPTRKVALKGHFATEVLLGKKWLFFDIDLKPDFSAIGGRRSLDEILSAGQQYALYENTIADSANIRRIFSEVSYGVTMEAPAPRAELFHTVTKFLSHWGWLLPLLIAIVCFLRVNKIQWF